MANGTFTAGALATMQKTINEVLGDNNSVSRHDLEYKPSTGAALLNNQTNLIGEIRESGKDYTVDVIWLQEDGTAVVSDPDVTECTLAGEELGAYKETKTILSTDGASITLQHDLGLHRGMYPSEEYARAVIVTRGMKLIAKAFNDDSYSFLGANIGTSQYAPETYVPSVNNNTGIHAGASDFVGEVIIPELTNSALVNRLGNYFLVAGAYWGAMYDKAITNGANDSGKGSALFFNRERWNFDPEKFAADAKKPIYQVSPKAYMAVHKNRNAAGVVKELSDDKYAYTMANPYLPGVLVDVLEQRQCSEIDANYDKIVWKFTLNYKHFLNPKSVVTGEATNTGIIKWRLT